MNKPTLILLRGLPGAGKSTLAKLLTDGGNFTFVEADQYFVDIYDEYHFDASKLHLAHQWCQQTTMILLNQHNNVIVSNTSTSEKEVQIYQDIANDCNAKFVSLIVENRHGNSSVHDVPQNTINRMRERFSVKL